jgi:hypothetical protein
METILLESNDNKIYEINKNTIIKYSALIYDVIGILANDNNVPIPLYNVHSIELEKIIKYCNYHMEHPEEDEYINNEYCDYISEFDKELLYSDRMIELVSSIYYMRIDNMINITAKVIAYKMKDKNVVELRKEYDIENDFSEKNDEARINK